MIAPALNDHAGIHRHVGERTADVRPRLPRVRREENVRCTLAAHRQQRALRIGAIDDDSRHHAVRQSSGADRERCAAVTRHLDVAVAGLRSCRPPV